ncbi:hypothetical protein T492DRAFT_832377 [Pavlovales sp. CCMP2436]|nr:hypothetical protein T492DRAFT_832377 [Pavlovales sp. CCMP2436]
MRAWPLSQARENIRIVIKLTDVLNYGKWSATPAGSIVLDNTRIWVSYVRIDPSIERRMVENLSGVVPVPCVDFTQTSTSVAIGSNYVSMPIAVRAKVATAICIAIRKTSNLGALGVFNVDRFTGGDVVGNVSYRLKMNGAFAGARGPVKREQRSHVCERSRLHRNRVSLQSVPMTEAIGDGLLVDSTIILEMNLGTQTSALRIDAFVHYEKVLAFANGSISFDA